MQSGGFGQEWPQLLYTKGFTKPLNPQDSDRRAEVYTEIRGIMPGQKGLPSPAKSRASIGIGCHGHEQYAARVRVVAHAVGLAG